MQASECKHQCYIQPSALFHQPCEYAWLFAWIRMWRHHYVAPISSVNSVGHWHVMMTTSICAPLVRCCLRNKLASYGAPPLLWSLSESSPIQLTILTMVRRNVEQSVYKTSKATVRDRTPATLLLSHSINASQCQSPIPKIQSQALANNRWVVWWSDHYSNKSWHLSLGSFRHQLSPKYSSSTP